MKARIGIADTGREIEVEIEDRDALAKRLETAYRKNTPILWFRDSRDRGIGIPLERVAFIEIIEDSDQSVGFAR